MIKVPPLPLATASDHGTDVHRVLTGLAEMAQTFRETFREAESKALIAGETSTLRRELSITQKAPSYCSHRSSAKQVLHGWSGEVLSRPSSTSSNAPDDESCRNEEYEGGLQLNIMITMIMATTCSGASRVLRHRKSHRRV